MQVISKGWYEVESVDGELTRNFHCEICRVIFATVGEVEIHVKTQHEKEYEMLKNIQ